MWVNNLRLGFNLGIKGIKIECRLVVSRRIAGILKVLFFLLLLKLPLGVWICLLSTGNVFHHFQCRQSICRYLICKIDQCAKAVVLIATAFASLRPSPSPLIA